MRYSHPEMAAEHGHYCVWHPTFSYDTQVINNRQDADSGKSSAKSSAVKQEQGEGRWELEPGEEAGWWEWSNENPNQLEWYAHADAQPEIWQPGSSSSSSGACGPAVSEPTAMPKKKGKTNHGRKAKKSPPLLH